MILNNTRNEINPTLSATGYTAGQVLFAPIKLEAMTLGNNRLAVLEQVGVFWDVAAAPSITLYFFAKAPTGFGNPGTTPTPAFDIRAALIGEIKIDNSTDYGTLHSTNHVLLTGQWAVLGADGIDSDEGWLVGVIDSAYSASLVDKLKITLTVDKHP